MAKFGHVFFIGLIWVIIAICIGLLGTWMRTLAGFWSIVGWIIAIVGYGFAFMSVLHLWRITSFQIKGKRMMRDDPQAFEKAKRRYQEAKRRVERDEK